MLRDAGSSARYDAEFAVSREQHQPSSDSGNVELRVRLYRRRGGPVRKKGGTRLPFLSGDLTLRESAGTCHANCNISTLIARSTIGTDMPDVKHRTSKWRIGHRASPCAGLRLAYSQESPPIGADKEEIGRALSDCSTCPAKAKSRRPSGIRGLCCAGWMSRMRWN